MLINLDTLEAFIMTVSYSPLENSGYGVSWQGRKMQPDANQLKSVWIIVILGGAGEVLGRSGSSAGLDDKNTGSASGFASGYIRTRQKAILEPDLSVRTELR